MRPVKPAPVRSDPAPSRLSYRVERLMLTPVFRFALRVGLPMAVTFGAVTWWFSVEANRAAFSLMISDVRAQIESRPEFEVRLMAIDGASHGVSEDIRERLALNFPVSSFDLDLPSLQEKVVELDAVKGAALHIRQGVLQVDVDERQPAVLWRHAGGLDLLDDTGVMVGPAERGRAGFPHLLVVAGDAAEDAIPEALDLKAAAGPLQPRMRGLERIGGRRWDVVLDRGQRVMLPETGAREALERAIAMHQAVDMLTRDIQVVDFRLPSRPTVRMTDHAVGELLRIRAIEAETREAENAQR